MTQIKCNVCGHQLEDEDSVCNYCRFASDMNLEWVDYIQKKEEEEDVQTKPKEFHEIMSGVDEALQETVKLAIQKTKIDFGVYLWHENCRRARGSCCQRRK